MIKKSRFLGILIGLCFVGNWWLFWGEREIVTSYEVSVGSVYNKTLMLGIETVSSENEDDEITVLIFKNVHGKSRETFLNSLDQKNIDFFKSTIAPTKDDDPIFDAIPDFNVFDKESYSEVISLARKYKIVFNPKNQWMAFKELSKSVRIIYTIKLIAAKAASGARLIHLFHESSPTECVETKPLDISIIENIMHILSVLSNLEFCELTLEVPATFDIDTFHTIEEQVFEFLGPEAKPFVNEHVTERGIESWVKEATDVENCTPEQNQWHFSFKTEKATNIFWRKNNEAGFNIQLLLPSLHACIFNTDDIKSCNILNKVTLTDMQRDTMRLEMGKNDLISLGVALSLI